MGVELNLILLVAAGFGYLAFRHHLRSGGRRRLAEHRGLHYRARGLEQLPRDFQQTVIFTLADGGHERDVATGNLVIGEDSVGFTSFDFEFQRDVRGEWAYLTSDPPFRLFSPTTILLYELPRRFAHLIIKRRGRSDLVSEELTEAYRSVATVAREATGIDRAMAISPPSRLPRRALTEVDEGFLLDYLVWAESQDQARMVLDPTTRSHLRSRAAGGRELVVELLDSMLLVYCATDGALSDADAAALAAYSDELCRRILAATVPFTPRGVGY